MSEIVHTCCRTEDPRGQATVTMSGTVDCRLFGLMAVPLLVANNRSLVRRCRVGASVASLESLMVRLPLGLWLAHTAPVDRPVHPQPLAGLRRDGRRQRRL